MTAPPAQAAVREAIAALPWAEPHAAGADGRLIVTIEAETSDAGLERLKVLKAMPGVVSAELVIHCFGDEAAPPSTGDPQATADYLNADAAEPTGRSFYSRLKAVGNF